MMTIMEYFVKLELSPFFLNRWFTNGLTYVLPYTMGSTLQYECKDARTSRLSIFIVFTNTI